jgi:hypothetical protein
MSLAAIIFVCLGGAFIVLFAAVLFSPLILIVDSQAGQLRVRWIAALEYWRPLPGKGGETGMSIAGIRMEPPTKPQRTPKQAEKKAAAQRVPKDRFRLARFARACLRERAIRRSLIASLRRLLPGLRHSIALTSRHLSISLPDPAWNGMLAGWLAATRGNSAIAVNFAGENAISFEVRLYPYRVVYAFWRFVIGLPYRALWREWRASSAPA